MARMNNERISKQIVTTRMEGIRKRGNPQKRWTDEVKEDLKITGIQNWLKVARDGKGCKRILLETNVNDGL